MTKEKGYLWCAENKMDKLFVERANNVSEDLEDVYSRAKGKLCEPGIVKAQIRNNLLHNMEISPHSADRGVFGKSRKLSIAAICLK